MGILDRLFGKSEPKNPEDEYHITTTEESIKVEHPRRKTEEILWKDIEAIKLINTDEGPFAPDVWLALIGKNSGCLIPQGSKGFERVYDIVSKYENFNFENFIYSMSSTDNEEFLLWRKEE
ncbi:hypothetical protein OIU83_20245 [Flavobacterium sp. LS1R49]|uniref:Uncharacterized protein n=1 Tax=Flavobacterium shii TaxID=2987687 RepID=A0A9X2ZJR8_9FLAO|nr:hypothetical protein [Flavobacterium shii]MCV9930002.1 hypothetical protein [Flavobacterium shii]